MSQIQLVDTTAEATKVTFEVAQDVETGGDRWRLDRVPFIPPRRSQGTINWEHSDPERDFVFAQDDWSGGGLAPFHDPQRPNRYAYSELVDARWKGVLSLGPARGGSTTVATDAIFHDHGTPFVFKNPSWEDGTAGWNTDTGITYTQVADPYKGTYAGQLVTDAGRSAGDVMLAQTVGNPTMLRGATFRFTLSVKRSAGSDGGIKIRIVDSVGNGSWSAASTSSSYGGLTATRTIDAGATSVTVQVGYDGGTDTGNTFQVDTALFKTSVNAGAGKCYGFAQVGDVLYGAWGQ